MQRRRKCLQFPLALALFIGLTTPALTRSDELVDRVVAVVDDDPILASEIDQLIALELVARQEGEDDDEYKRRVLDLLIEQKLRFHEVDRFGFAEVPVEAVEDALRDIEQEAGGKEALERRLEESELDRQILRQIVARQVMVLIYIEERLGARVFVGLEDIQQYYDDVLVPDLTQRGLTVPAIQDVRESIRSVLREQRMNEELEKWTVELRSRADIEDFFDSHSAELPPLLSSTD